MHLPLINRRSLNYVSPPSLFWLSSVSFSRHPTLKARFSKPLKINFNVMKYFQGFAADNSKGWRQLDYIFNSGQFPFVYQLVICDDAHHMVFGRFQFEPEVFESMSHK